MRKRLLLAVAVVSALGLAVELWASVSDDVVIRALWSRFSLSVEANIPTWFSSALLAGAAVAAGAIAHEATAGRRHWWGICVALAYVSMDETAELHENLGGHLDLHGVLYFDWVIWAALAVAILAALYLPFLWKLPSPTRERLILAAVIYVGGALVMELPLGWWVDHVGEDTLGYALIDWVEETMEMIGAALALSALVEHARTRT